MHELSIAMSILDLAAEEFERQRGSRVAAIHLKLGPLSGLVKAALQSAYELARENSSCETAELLIEEIPMVAFCPKCSEERTLASAQHLCCPVCGTATPNVIGGRELEVVALEIEP
jgi:hydrogenase nickel incorporation protein HypA/HybF